MLDKIKIVTTGGGWIGEGRRSFDSIISELITNAHNKVTFTIFIITNASIVDQIENALNRGILVEIYIYTGHKYSINMLKRLVSLESHYEKLTIHQISDKTLHAKLMIADNSKILMGSANLSYKGLEQNYEIGFYVENVRIAQELLIILKKLI